MSDLDRPNISASEIQRLLGAELSSRSRFGYVAFLLASLAFAGATASLWLTEPALPIRTHIGFAFIVAINLCWAAFALWVVSRKRVLLAGHSIIAARMSVAFSTILVLFCVGIAVLGPFGRPAYLASGFGLLMLLVALALLARARRRFSQLTDRRRSLERQLEKGDK